MMGLVTTIVKALPWTMFFEFFFGSRKRKPLEPTPWAAPSSHTREILVGCRKVLKASDVALYIFHNGNQPASMKVLESSHHEDTSVPEWAWDEKLDPYNCGVMFAYQWHGRPYFDNLDYSAFPDTQPIDLFGTAGVTHILAYPIRSKDRSKVLGSVMALWTDHIPYDVDAISLMEDEATKIEATLIRKR